MRALPLVAAALAAVVHSAALLPVTAAAVPAAPGQDATEARLDVVHQTPWVEPDGPFLLSLDVDGAPEGSRIESVLHRDPVEDRADYNLSLLGQELGDREPVRMQDMEVDDLPPSGSGRRAVIGISLVKPGRSGPGLVSLEDGLVRAGAYPLDVRLIGPDGSELDRIITHLVRLPDELDGIERLRAAMVFDVHAAPSVRPDATTHLASADLDRIAALVVALRAHPEARVTLDPTPETIEALAREEGRPQELLTRLVDALPNAQVIDGPFVDVPVSAWIGAGMHEELNLQRGRGNAVLTEHLERPDRTTWVASRELTAEAAAALWEAGVTRFVLPEGSVGRLPDDPAEPTPARPFELVTRVDAPVQAVARDTQLGDALGRRDDTELRALQLVAQLAVIQNEAPDRARGVVFGPSPDDDIASRVVAEVLALLEGHPLVRTATVAEVFDDVDPIGGGPGGPVVTRELTPELGPDLGDYPERLRAAQARIGSFSQMIRQSDGLLASWQQRLLVSGAGEVLPATRNRYIDVIQATIDRRIAEIQTPLRQTVTLTSREGVIPFTLRNQLDRPVDLMLELEAGSRVEFPDGAIRVFTVEPGTRQIRLRVRTRSPGVVPVNVRVSSRDGGILIATSRVTVRSTAVAGIGYVLTVGAAAFLVVWWASHWRRARRERREDVTATPVAGS